MIQSILFDNSLFTVANARAWLRRHNFRSAKVHTTKRYHRFRQGEPKGRLRTISLDKGIKAIVSFK